MRCRCFIASAPRRCRPFVFRSPPVRPRRHDVAARSRSPARRRHSASRSACRHRAGRRRLSVRRIGRPPFVSPSAPVLTLPEPVGSQEPEVLAPRRGRPLLDVDCILVADTEDPTCFDDGFPAISAGGTLIATLFYPPMGQNDVFAVEIHIIDVKTSRSSARSPSSMSMNRSRSCIQTSPRPTLYRASTQRSPDRTAQMQRFLDAKRFRLMTSVEPSSLPRPVRWNDDLGHARGQFQTLEGRAVAAT